MKLYDATNGTGNLLSTGSLTQTIVANTANTVNVTFNGVVASLSIGLGASGTAGTSASIPVMVNALDADGNTIVGPGVYVNASDTPLTIALSDSDSSGATALSTTSVTQPTSGITISYTGLAIVPATISASATGITTNTTMFTPTLQPIVVTTGDTQNPSFAGIDFYATSGTGSTGSFTISEVGWTNAPYDKTLSVTPGSGCTNIGGVVQTGNSFAATVAGTPSPGTCTVVTLSDGAGQSQAVTLAYTLYGYSGALQNLTLPAGVTSITITALGAYGGGAGGSGAGEIGTFAVTAGTALNVLAGQAGATAGNSAGGGGGGSFVYVAGAASPLIAGGGGGGGGATGDPGSNASFSETGSTGDNTGGIGGTDGNGGGCVVNSGGGGGYSTGGNTCNAVAGGASVMAGGAGGLNATFADGGFGGGGAAAGPGGGGGGYSGGGGGGDLGPVGAGGGGGSFNAGTNASTTRGALIGGNGNVIIVW